jgi:exonuclease SbcC
LCGQPLSPEHRRATLEQLQEEGTRLGDTWRANRSTQEDLGNQLAAVESELQSLEAAEAERLQAINQVAQLTEHLAVQEQAAREWKAGGEKRLRQLVGQLQAERYAPEARKQLIRLDKELAALGYDAADHDAARANELQARAVEGQYQALSAAQAALRPLEDEIENLKLQVSSLQGQIATQQEEFNQVSGAVASAEAGAPDVDAAERSLDDLQEQENRLHQELGAARQKVGVLEDQRIRREKFLAERTNLGGRIGQVRTLERAFGRDGVPALLIEQALPEIETRANDLLDRLSDGTMSVRFVTQSAYKDKKRADLKETLGIQISDGSGPRDYELFSGGEAFRVNFAIRLALSEVLAGRIGARLQMLVIDEGFGSQDEQGRQRLVQAIHAVQKDFAKILVITHLEELKDAFPTRIEVEKTDRGSTVVVV